MSKRKPTMAKKRTKKTETDHVPMASDQKVTIHVSGTAEIDLEQLVGDLPMSEVDEDAGGGESQSRPVEHRTLLRRTRWPLLPPLSRRRVEIMRHPVLPPAWKSYPRPTAMDMPTEFRVVDAANGLVTIGTLEQVETAAWAAFGIPRETWEAMEKDHQALAMIRELKKSAIVERFEDVEPLMDALRYALFNDEDPADVIIQHLENGKKHAVS